MENGAVISREEALLLIENHEYGVLPTSSYGAISLAESFSSITFADLIARDEDSGERYTIMTNIEPFTPLVLTTAVNVIPSIVMESFESSIKMFDRGIVYPFKWSKESSNRDRIDRLTETFFDPIHRETTYFHSNRYNTVKTASFFLANYDIRSAYLNPLVCAVVDTRNVAFILAARRHGMAIPRGMITVLVNDSIYDKNFPFAEAKKLYLRDIYPILLDSRMRIERVSNDLMQKLIYRPDKRFLTIADLKQEIEAVWRIIHNRQT